VTGQFKLIHRIREGRFTIGVFSDGEKTVRSFTLPRTACVEIRSHLPSSSPVPVPSEPIRSSDPDIRETPHSSHTGL